jgi:carbamoyl-phosphate synthase small subunit
MREKQSAALILEDGAVFSGWTSRSVGVDANANVNANAAQRTGEVCFNTSMTGYQEVLTDPSYAGQIVCFTTPHLGNVGISPLDMESTRAWTHGVIARDLTDVPCNYRSRESLDAFLMRQGVPGLFGVDTRALTQHLRDHGAKRGIITTGTVADAARQIHTDEAYDDVDWVLRVSTKVPYRFTEGLDWGTPDAPSIHLGMSATGVDVGGGAKDLRHASEVNATRRATEARFRVVVLDCGVKLNILRSLVSAGCDVEVVPAQTSASDILARNPDGVVLSNGPGDPTQSPYVIETTQALLGKLPILGICLGHQMLALALGVPTYKLKFGHRGGNHPVMTLKNKHVQMTSQNHGFAVDLDAAAKIADLRITHINLNDQTCEGFASDSRSFLSVQYHPEAAPGPLDACSVFTDFNQLMGHSELSRPGKES